MGTATLDLVAVAFVAAFRVANSVPCVGECFTECTMFLWTFWTTVSERLAC